jgi:hypothetical protein
MADKTTSQAQQESTQSQQTGWAPPGADFYRKLAEEQIGRMSAAFGELDKVQARILEQARQAIDESEAIDESARLAKESMAYMAELGAEWRRIAMDAGRQAGERFATATPPTTNVKA